MKKLPSWIGKSAIAVVGVGGTVLLFLWLIGAFHDKVATGPAREVLRRRADAATLEVRARAVPVYESAVGSIRPVTETRIGSKILARVKVMHVVRAGQPFRRGDVLVELEAADLDARLAEAQAALQAAEATLAKARTDLARSEQLFAQNLASKERLDRDRTAVDTADADARRLQQTVVGARTALGYARVTAPIEGIAIDKHVNEGDMVSPGQVLVTMYDPSRLQLIAVVREQLAARLNIGNDVDVHIDALDKHCAGRIDQIVPESKPGSRSFEVKVTGPCTPEVMSGMFGRLLVPIGDRSEIRVPRRAVRSVGQLDFVFVVLPGDRLLRRFVRTGSDEGETVEILSGLVDGETILADAREVE